MNLVACDWIGGVNDKRILCSDDRHNQNSHPDVHERNPCLPHGVVCPIIELGCPDASERFGSSIPVLFCFWNRNTRFSHANGERFLCGPGQRCGSLARHNK